MGRDCTARFQRQFKGLPLNDGDDMGRPPFPDEKTLPADEYEYVHRWLDHYFHY
jgi:hypothetical protein